MYALSYLINNSFCLLIMAFIFVCYLRGPDTRQSTGLFRAMVIGMMAFTVLDVLCGLQENGAIRPTRWCVEVLNVLYFSVSAATVFVACLYTENELGATWLGNRKKIGLLALPLLVLVVCLPLTLQYGFFFYISSDGRYIKGPAYVLMALMSYGHLEGDRALICLADALKDAAAECKCLIARFGGDEFTVAMEPKSEEEVTRFQEELRRFLAMHNAAMETPYTIHISIGCTRCTPEHTSIPALIQAADKALYQAKAAGKQSRANLH